VPARVHLYGPGPRLRALCAQLVSAVLPQAEISGFEDREGALRAARAARHRTLVLDARVAPEPAAFRAFASGSAGVGTAWGFDETLRAAAEIVDAESAATREPAAAIGHWLDGPQTAARPPAGTGVEVHSPGFAHGGYASAARNTIVGLHRAGVRVSWRQFYPERESVDIDGGDRALLNELARAEFPPDCALLIQPPTHITGQVFLPRYVDAYASRPYVCYTMFETDRVPARWPSALAEAARIWVPSKFNLETFAASGIPAESIDYVPLGLEVERFVLDGERLEVAGRRGFTFLSVFGFSSRKGWDVLLEAWARAFGRDDDVSLILRTSAQNVDVRAEIDRLMHERRIDAARCAPIVLLEQGLSAQALAALYRSADAFVLPSRGEGVGLPYLEAMAFGLPTIGTAWSGATEFLTAATGYPVESSLELVDRMTTRTYPVLRDQEWAAPSVDATARALREVFERRAEASARAAQGYALARAQYNRTRTGRLAAAALRRVAPRRRVFASSALVRYTGDIFSTGAGGASARSTIAALEHAGVAVAAVASGVDQRAAIFLDDARMLKRALARDGSGAVASIVQTGTAALSVMGRELRVRPAIDVDRWTPQLGGLSGLGAASTFRFLTTAALDERSGYDRAIGAFLRAFEPGSDVMLGIKVPGGPVDPGYARELIASAAGRHAPDRVAHLGNYRISILAGIVPESDYMQLLGSFDAYVHVPYAAGATRVLLEAMATALACIRIRTLDDGIARSDATAFMVDENLESIASAMRAIANDPCAAALRGHAARRAVVASHGLDVAGRDLRRELEEIAGCSVAAAFEPDRDAGVLGVVVDRRGVEGDAQNLLTALTRREHRCLAVADRGPSFSAAVEALRDCAVIAYVRADAIVTSAWDAILIDALESRPLVKLVVPAIVDAPAPQGIRRADQPLAEFARGLTVTQAGRGLQPSKLVTTCVVFDAAALLAAVRERASSTVDDAVRLVADGGKAAWCAFDTIVDRGGTGPWPLVELG
jgi:glycosyltransferase involved in cell wall biosynthesis